MAAFDTTLNGLVRTKKGQLAKFSPKLVDKILETATETAYTKTSSLASPEFLDEFLWKNYSESSTDNHVLLISAGIASCGLTGVMVAPQEEQLQSLLTRLIQIYERKSTSSTHKVIILRALSTLVRHPETPAVRRCLAPMFSILSWSELEFKPTSDGLEEEYQVAMKKLQALSPRDKAGRLKLSSIVHIICQDAVSCVGNTELVEQILEFLCLVLSQLPTRRFVKTIIDQSNALLSLQQSKKNEKLRPLTDLMKYYLTFPIDEFSGEMKEIDQLKREQTTTESFLQSMLYANHKDVLGDFLFRTSSISTDLSKTKSELTKLHSTDIDQLLLAFKISTKNTTLSADQKIDLILTKITPQPDASQILESISPVPSRDSLLQAHLDQLSLPELGPQYLSLSDLLLRNYQILRADAFNTIAQHLINTLIRLKKQKNQDKITGTSRHAVPIKGLSLEKKTYFATAQSTSYETTITVDLQSSPPVSLPEWDDLVTGDVLLFGKMTEKLSKSTDPFLKEGFTTFHSAILLSSTRSKKSSKSITLTLSIDPRAFENDTEESFKDMNILIKLPPRIKSYKRMLDSIASVIDSNDDILPEWLLETLLGYGDVNAGSWLSLKDGSVNLGKVNIETLKKAFDGVDIQFDDEGKTKKRRVSEQDGESVDDIRSIKLHFNDDIIRVSNSTCTTDLSMLTVDQLKSSISSLFEGLTVISGASGTGKRSLVSKIIELSKKTCPSERLLIVSKNAETLSTLLQMVEKNGLSPESVFNMVDNTTTKSKIELANNELTQLLSKVDEIAVALGEEGAWGNDTETAGNFYKYHIVPKWEKFLLSVKKQQTVETVLSYPFSKFGHVDLGGLSLTDSLRSIIDHYSTITSIFDKISRLAPLSYLDSSAQSDYLLSSQACVIGTTIDQLVNDSKKFIEDGIIYHNVIIMEASQMNDFETLFPLLFNPKSVVKKVTLVGDEKNLGPVINGTSTKSSLKKSLFGKLIDRGIQVVRLNEVFNRGGDVVSLLTKYYPELTSRAEKKRVIKFKEVRGNLTENQPGFYQNILEAESAIDAVAEILESGADLSDVVVLTPYESQKVLLMDVASAKLNVSPMIETLDGFRGKERKYVVVSLVHTEKALEDRTAVALLSSGVEKLVIVCSNTMRALF